MLNNNLEDSGDVACDDDKLPTHMSDDLVLHYVTLIPTKGGASASSVTTRIITIFFFITRGVKKRDMLMAEYLVVIYLSVEYGSCQEELLAV